jgi:hypothetical protein
MMHSIKWTVLAVLATALVGIAYPSSAQQVQREQLIAATINAGDLAVAGLPGDWGTIDVHVTSALNAERRRTALTFVVVELLNWSNGADFESAVNLFPGADAAAADYDSRRETDVEAFGPISDSGPSVPNARLMRKDPREGLGHAMTLRWQHG